jgi:hypothetical protein
MRSPADESPRPRLYRIGNLRIGRTLTFGYLRPEDAPLGTEAPVEEFTLMSGRRAAHAKVNAVPRFRHPVDKMQSDFSPNAMVQISDGAKPAKRKWSDCTNMSESEL